YCGHRAGLADPALCPGPDGHRGHGIEHRPRRFRVAAPQRPGPIVVVRDATRLRRTDNPAPALGQRRADHLPEVAPLPSPPPSHDVPAPRSLLGVARGVEHGGPAPRARTIRSHVPNLLASTLRR